jgi:two-component system, cell cycle sensor histidine kinase and response regulator CckA
MKILSVDDNEQNLYLIEAVGRSHGFHVCSARNGLEALEELSRQSFDLIVSDILMPEMDGFQLCYEVKSRERTRNVPFVFYTATYTTKQDESLGLSLGASRYVLKPVDPDAFIAIVEDVMRDAQRRGASVPAVELKSPVDYLRAYSARLVDKLDHKIEELERAKGGLQTLLDAKDREIAQRERAEEERATMGTSLRQSEERFRRAILEAPIPIMIHTEEGRVLQVNRAWLEQSGYAAEEISTVSDWREKASLGVQPGRNEDSQRLDAPASMADACELPLRTASGKYRTWAFSAAPLGPMPGGGRMVITMAMDVTERRSLERQLAQAQKMEAIGQLAGGVAHDFNNLLTVISGYSNLLLQSLSPIDPASEQVREIAKAADRAAALTRQLLAVSRKQVFEPANVDINSVIRESLGMLRRLIGEDIEIRIVLAAEELRALVDAGQLGQVIMNLAVNARDAMPKGGVLLIETGAAALGPEDEQTHSAMAAGSYVQLMISDTGVGMDQATLARIFEPFFTTKAPGEGTGLGLSTVYGIVKQSNGDVRAYSEPGRGTTFRIYLPRVFERMAAPVAQEAPAPARGSETLLLVEDEPSLRKLMREILRQAGYKVIDAANGGEALLVCEQYSSEIALIITDLVMPGMTGMDLAKRLEALRPGTKVLYMSGYSSHAALANGALVRHEHFIQKPFTPSALTDKVRYTLDRGQANRVSS